jgi:hypothetical protein
MQTNLLSAESDIISFSLFSVGEYQERNARGKVLKIIPTLEKLPNVTFLEAYNCDSSPLPKPKFGDRAKKQIYRTDYVLNHFVHYSTVTKPYMELYQESSQQSKKWRMRIGRDKSERVTDEIHEALMVHTKIVTWKNSRETDKRCHYSARSNPIMNKRGCFVGFPSPNGTALYGQHDANGMEYNCYINQKVENYWLPKLKERLREREQLL